MSEIPEVIPPAPAAQTPPPVTPPVETITLPKAEHDELQRKAAIASEAQSRADRLERDSRFGNKKKLEQPEFLTAPELIKAKQLITEKVLQRPDYQALTASNPELAKALMRDPSMLLDVDEFVDAQDLADQVLNYLDNKIEAQKAKNPAPSTPPNAEPTPLPSTVTPPDKFPAAKTEEERREEEFAGRPPIERIAGKLEGRIKFQ